MTAKMKNEAFSIPSWVMPVISIITVLLTLGVHWGLVQAQLDKQEAQITQLEAKTEIYNLDRLSIETRLTRMETDLTYIRSVLERMQDNALQQR